MAADPHTFGPTASTDTTDDDLDADSRLLGALRDELVVEPDQRTRWLHVSEMVRVSRSIRPSTPARRRRGTRLAAALGTGAVVIGLTGGLAAAGSLPPRLQHASEAVARAVGLEIDGSPAGPDRPSRTPDADGGTPVKPPPSASTSVVPGTVPAPSPSKAPPSASTAPPGNPSNAPGQPGDPGNPGNAPGEIVDPGNSGNAPGQIGDPGNSGNAPGQPGDPGYSGNAPGHDGAPGRSALAPGHPEDDAAAPSPSVAP